MKLSRKLVRTVLALGVMLASASPAMAIEVDNEVSGGGLWYCGYECGIRMQACGIGGNSADYCAAYFAGCMGSCLAF